MKPARVSRQHTLAKQSSAMAQLVAGALRPFTNDGREGSCERALGGEVAVRRRGRRGNGDEDQMLK